MSALNESPCWFRFPVNPLELRRLALCRIVRLVASVARLNQSQAVLGERAADLLLGETSFTAADTLLAETTGSPDERVRAVAPFIASLPEVWMQ